jgi:hypothetical protein
MDTGLIPAILWLFSIAHQPLTTTSSVDGLKHTVTAHIATPIFLLPAQVYFLDLASQLNHLIISRSSKLSAKMRIATYGYAKRKYRFSITGVRVSTGYARQKRARPPVANDLLLGSGTCMCRNTQFCNNSSDVFLGWYAQT